LDNYLSTLFNLSNLFINTYPSLTMSAPSETSKIEHVPGPWTLKGTIYTFATYTSAKAAAAFPDNKDFFYAPLELNSGFAEGEMVGGLGMVQVIRYSESPVGPYDELLVVPGFFKREEIVDGNANGNEVGKKEKAMKSNVRVTRIYVSQERTCWNGRKSKFVFGIPITTSA
jgi:hypothetical protein